MNKFLKVLSFSLLLSTGFARAQNSADVWNAGYAGGSQGNSRVWSGPGFNVTRDSLTRGSTFVPSGGAVTVIENGAVALGDGRSVGLTAKRLISGANVVKGVKNVATAVGALSGGPLGVAILLMELPSFIDWVTKDNAVHVRASPTAGFEKLDSTVCSFPPCYQYFSASVQGAAVSGWGLYTTPMAALQKAVANYNAAPAPGWVASAVSATATVGTWHMQNGASGFDGTTSISKSEIAPESAKWVRATYDEVANYIQPLDSPGALVPQVLRLDGSVIDPNTNLMQHYTFDSTPVSVTGPSPALPALAPYVVTTNYPKPSDQTSSRTVGGNPYGLAAGVATVIGVVSGSAPLAPGSTSASGPAPVGSGTPSAGPLNTPTTTTTTATFDQVNNLTNIVDKLVQDAAQQVTTTTTTTNITNTTNTSNVTNNTTNVTNVTNTTTGQPLAPTKTDTKTDAPVKDPTKTDCELNPSHIGCAEFGTPSAPEAMPRTSIPVSLSNTVFAAPSGCPAALAFTMFAKPYSISYDGLCNTLPPVRLIFLALGAAMAVMIFMEGLKT